MVGTCLSPSCDGFPMDLVPSDLALSRACARVAACPGPPSFAATPEPGDTWASLANDIFKGRPLADGTGLVGIEMPARAEDAAIVPVTMRVTLPSGDSRRLKALTLVIDDNPVPVAATFKFGDNAGVSVISTRVRVNSYTDVHVVAELSDSKLYVVKTYVKASGGCSAPAAKNADEAIANLGQMQFRVFGKPTDGAGQHVTREAQIMIRHPNNSGLQRDQVSLLYIPANFVDELRVWQGDALLFSMKLWAFRYRKIRTSASPTFPMAPRCSRSRPETPKGSCSGREWPGDVGDVTRSASETAHLGFRLRAAQVGHRKSWPARSAKLRPDFSDGLCHAQHGLGRDVAVVWHHQRDHVAIEQAHCSSARRVSHHSLHAGEDIIGARDGSGASCIVKKVCAWTC